MEQCVSCQNKSVCQKFALLDLASFETNFVRILGTSNAKTSVREKAECLLAIGEDKKLSFLEGPSPLTHSNTKESRRQSWYPYICFCIGK